MYNGIINIYKEKGFTSFDVVAKLRGIFHQKKIGHTGTLDPDAEGVLLVCLGNATKVCDMLTDQDKEYEAVMLLGVETDTQDISGTVLKEVPVDADEAAVREAIMSFVGSYAQVPPMYSARKVGGKKLYELARAGITVERQAKKVQIYEINIVKIELPRVTMRIRCSKGTYIRTLCNDIGDKLGCGACMEELLRTRVGQFGLEDALRVSQVEKIVKTIESDAERTEDVNKILHTVDSVFEQYPALLANVNLTKPVINGNKIPADLLLPYQGSGCMISEDGELVRLYLEDGAAIRFIGVYSYQESEKLFKPVKLFL